jgi:putative ABC transport system permease protein
MWRDLFFAWRALRHRPGFTVTAVLTLALGVGAATAMFSVIQATLLRPLPFGDAQQLTMILGVFGPDEQIRGSSYPESMDWRGARGFAGMSVQDPITTSLSGDAEAEQVPAELVSANYFELLRVRPHIGRALQSGDDVPGGPRSAVLSYDLWRRRYGGEASVLGRRITVQGVPLTVVGVMPEGFRGVSFQAQIWSTHAALTPQVLEDRGSRWLNVIGRLNPNTTAETGERAVQTIARDLETRFPQNHTQRSAIVQSLRESYLGSTERLLTVLFGAAVLLLLIACVNVASLQLVRASGRVREMSLRNALGATRLRLARQLMAEGLVLSLLGGVVGLLTAYWALDLFLPLIPAGVLPPYATVSVDGFAALFALAVAALCGIASAVLPALRSSQRDLGSDLRTRGASGYRVSGRVSTQQILVGSEVALAFLVLVGAGLLLRSLQQQMRIDAGFSTDGVLVARIALPTTAYPRERRGVFADALLERVRAIPGVQRAALGSDAPLRGNSNGAWLWRASNDDVGMRYFRHRVTPDFFAALGMQVVRGRGFTENDRIGTESVVLVGETAARKLFPDADALGQRLRFGQSPESPLATVVGIIKDARYRTLTAALTDPAESPDVYMAFAQLPAAEFELIVRTTATAQSVIPQLRRAVSEIDAAIPLHTIDTLDRAMAAATAQARFASMLLTLFAILALTLAAIGVYGVMAYYVSTSAREIAIRIAVGAEPASMRRLVLRRGGTLVLAGTIVGAIGALALTRVLRVLLFGVQERDPLTFVAVGLVLGIVALLANYIPAWRATRVDPQLVLRGQGV